MNSKDDSLRFPIGRFSAPTVPYTAAERTALIQEIAALPVQLAAVAHAIGDETLEHAYRPDGWTGRQVIHHVADSHMNCYFRYRLALTEDNPTIRPYDEKAWAELPDVAATPILVSLALVEALHLRWVTLLHHLTDEQWQRTFYHPGYQTTHTLDHTLGLYAWHGRHHLGHLKLLLPKG